MNDIQHRNAAITRTRDIYSAGRIYGAPHSDLTDRVQHVLENLPKRTPQYVRSYIRGYAQCLTDKLYEHDLVYAHVAPDGTRYTAHKDVPSWAQSVDPLYKAGRGAEISTWDHGHFWKGNGKRFF